MTVDEFVEQKVQPELRPVAAAIRGLMREFAPDAQEAISYGLPMYRINKWFAWISVSKKDVGLAFARGSQIEDRHGLLRLGGKASMHVKMKSLDAVNRPALKDYIEQAVKLDRS